VTYFHKVTISWPADLSPVALKLGINSSKMWLDDVVASGNSKKKQHRRHSPSQPRTLISGYGIALRHVIHSTHKFISKNGIIVYYRTYFTLPIFIKFNHLRKNMVNKKQNKKRYHGYELWSKTGQDARKSYLPNPTK